MNHAMQWNLGALDTWFFRESRPIEAIGGARLQSVFPPPARTMIGAIRTIIGQAHDVDWGEYRINPGHPLRAVMGDASDLGPLKFAGPYVIKDGKRLYPAPATLLQGSDEFMAHLTPAELPTESDLGRIRLPEQKLSVPGAKPLEGSWLTHAGMQAFLEGQVPAKTEIVKAEDLYATEDRLGIARNNKSAAIIDGLLYQTRHIRPLGHVEVAMKVSGLSTAAFDPSQKGTVRLGAEGRLAAWSCGPSEQGPTGKPVNGNLLLVLLTHAQFERGWLPDGFEQRTDPDKGDYWEGELHGARMRLVSAALGKPVREGGWDMAARAPRPMHGLVPAGSCYFMELLDPKSDTVHLNYAQIGQDISYGRGEILVGRW